MEVRYWQEPPPPAPLDNRCPPEHYDGCSLLLTLLQHQVAPHIAQRELYAASMHCSTCNRYWCAGTIERAGEFDWHVFPCDRDGEFWPPIYQGDPYLRADFANMP